MNGIVGNLRLATCSYDPGPFLNMPSPGGVRGRRKPQMVEDGPDKEVPCWLFLSCMSGVRRKETSPSTMGSRSREEGLLGAVAHG